jgi:phage tail sheath protein FI
MPFQLSPGVVVSEVDLTTVVPAVSTSAGAFAGGFLWGPVNKRVLIPNEDVLGRTFSFPDANTYVEFFTCSSFLAYADNLTVVRAANTSTTFNAIANTTLAAIEGTCIPNEDVFQPTYLLQKNNDTFGPFMARYPGALGNSLMVSMIDAGAVNPDGSVDTANVFNQWPYESYFSGAPNTSTSSASSGGAYDELHIVVIDKLGYLSQGVANTVLEVFPFLSKAEDAIDSLGNSNYYKQVIFDQSKFIYAVDPPDYANTNTTWGSSFIGTQFARIQSTATANQYSTWSTSSLVGGADGAITTAALQTAWDEFTNADEVDISLAITGDPGTTVQQYVIDNIANQRKDCVAFLSPPSTAVINNAGSETNDITTWINSLARSTSYAVVDSGWKYMFDKYNNTYRWVPLNGDIAGLCAYTDQVRDAWWSPAGFNRGNLKNVVRLAWNPNKTYRDVLYSTGVNPVATFPGNGTVLYGDKTLQAKPSAFDRINVRRLFIVLEKAIARAAKYSLFEFNDEFTRAQFVALVTPFLRDVQGRRGIYDFRVVCDTTNNTPQVIDSNQFVGDIYIKPARSINFIQLNFVAVRTGVDFTEVVGKF